MKKRFKKFKDVYSWKDCKPSFDNLGAVNAPERIRQSYLWCFDFYRTNWVFQKWRKLITEAYESISNGEELLKWNSECASKRSKKGG